MPALNEKNILERVTEETRGENRGPGKTREQIDTAAATITSVTSIGTLSPGTVGLVTYTPSKNVSPVGSGTRTYKVVNRGSANLGSATVAEVAKGSAPAFLPVTVTLSATAANLQVLEGDQLVFESVPTGECVDPGGVVTVKSATRTPEAITTEPYKKYVAEGFVGTPPTGA